MFTLEEVEVDAFDLYLFEVEGNSDSPGGGTLGEGIQFVHSLRYVINIGLTIIN